MLRRAALLAAAAVALAGCGGGGGPSARDVLSATAANLGKIRSGELTFSLLVTPHSPSDEQFGFELSGPFSLGKDGSLPIADVDYTQIANGHRATVKVLSTGSKAYAAVGGRTYELPTAQAAQLRAAGTQLRRSGGLRRLSIGKWVHDPRVSDGGEVGGARTNRVHAALNTVAAVDDLVAAAGGLGGGVNALGAVNARRLEKAVRDSSFDLYSGKSDHLLRKLALSIDLGFDVPTTLRKALGNLVGARISVELGVSDPNKKITVATPTAARPYSELKKP